MFVAFFFILLLNGVNIVTWVGSTNTQSDAFSITTGPIGTNLTAEVDTELNAGKVVKTDNSFDVNDGSRETGSFVISEGDQQIDTMTTAPSAKPAPKLTTIPTKEPSAPSSIAPSVKPNVVSSAVPSGAPMVVPMHRFSDGITSVCWIPGVVNIAAGTRVARMLLPRHFTLTFSLSLPLALDNDETHVFDLRDAVTGKSLLAMTRSGTSSTQWFYNDLPVVNGWEMISGSIGGSTTLTTFKVSVHDTILRLQSNYQDNQLDYVIANVDTKGGQFDLYASPPALPTSGGTISAININSSTAVPPRVVSEQRICVDAQCA